MWILVICISSMYFKYRELRRSSPKSTCPIDMQIHPSRTCMNLFLSMVIVMYSFKRNSKTEPTATQKTGSPFLCPPKKDPPRTHFTTDSDSPKRLRHSEVLLSGTVGRKSTRAWSWEQMLRTGFKQHCGGGTFVHGYI